MSRQDLSPGLRPSQPPRAMRRPTYEYQWIPVGVRPGKIDHEDFKREVLDQGWRIIFVSPPELMEHPLAPGQKAIVSMCLFERPA